MTEASNSHNFVVETESGSIEGARFGDYPTGLTPVVCLHEGLGSLSMWRDFPERLQQATGRPVFAYSRAGYGRSTPLFPFGPDFLNQQAAQALPDFLDRIGLQRPILYGHSDGASIALLYAAMYPGAVAALILESPHVFVEPCCLEAIAALTVPKRFAELSHQLTRHHQMPGEMLRRWTSAWLDPVFASWRCDTELAAVFCPTLLIQGLADPYGTVAQIHEIIAHIGGPVESWLIPGSGHAPHRELPQQTAAKMADFLLKAAEFSC